MKLTHLAQKNNISLNVIENSLENEILSLPGNPISNEKLKEYLQKSIASGIIRIEYFKKNLLANYA